MTQVPEVALLKILLMRLLFPDVLLLLYIIEPHYLWMLRDVLEFHPMFGVAIQRPTTYKGYFMPIIIWVEMVLVYIISKDFDLNLLLMGGDGGMYRGGEVSAVLVGAFTGVVVVQS